MFTPVTHQRPETLLPELEEIRAVGLAFDRGEHEQGIISIAAPIVGGGGRVIGAISIATSVNRMPLDEIGKYRPALMRTAAQIGREGAVWPYPVAS